MADNRVIIAQGLLTNTLCCQAYLYIVILLKGAPFNIPQLQISITGVLIKDMLIIIGDHH